MRGNPYSQTPSYTHTPMPHIQQQPLPHKFHPAIYTHPHPMHSNSNNPLLCSNQQPPPSPSHFSACGQAPFKFGVRFRYPSSTSTMASSSSVSVFNNHRFKSAFNEELYNSIVKSKKVTAECCIDLDEDEYPEVKEQISLRG
ncbi:hypothetical protein PIB30_107246 [Stylosanthes scabra]|uniref:Uncharacterized protein n=1 Tax=Stylosanthes scabra TaxID=79078 RepID=A0ABU6RZX8_9FABA|nr:hypothetical protein [Stylosanthes scabra]